MPAADNNSNKSHNPFHAGFHRPNAGSHTVEGNVSGARAAHLEQQRLAQQQEFERTKQAKQQQNQAACMNIHSKFQTARMGSVQEQAFRAKTVGLVSAQDFLQAAKEQEDDDNTKTTPVEDPKITKAKAKKLAKQSKKRKRAKKQLASRLSFANADEEEEEDETDTTEQPVKNSNKQKTSLKDPTVDTSFLPDQQREQEQEALRQKLEQDWKEKQAAIREEALEITYSYWDGSGHRRTCTITKGSSIGDFLEQIRQDLCHEFRELSTVGADALMYVKEDLILPQDVTFYDLIATKARGKSGPLFHFDVHEDVRVGPLDRRVEKDESHPGKVVERQWYERNKHIFPASRWELYDPAKTYGTYTIGGGIVQKKE